MIRDINVTPPTMTSTEWHSIRPWTPHLALSVREVSSVSATFILSSVFSSIQDDPSVRELDSDSEAIIADALAKGLSVNVNGSSWQRVLIRTDDSADEAVIIIYGLMPGRQYDIDLGLVEAGTMHKQILTEG